MEEPKKSYFCKSCGKDDSKVKFYTYLHTKCMMCKRKSVKESKDNKFKALREEKIDAIDPDEKIRYLWSEMIKEPFYKNGRKSILDFMEETEQDISDLVIGVGDIKVDCVKITDSLKENILSLLKFQKEINLIIDSRVDLKISALLKDYELVKK